MWYKEAIGYQIYPKSFNDTNGDGIGDLRGIIDKLDYFTYIGVDLLWLGPIYKSPMDDNGYDVSDFYQIDPIFGDLDDFKELVEKAHSRGIKITMDLVLNHTSDEHPWFVESRKSLDNPYRDYYIWQKGKIVDGKEVEPTNWASFFGGSCWEKDGEEYYMKIFSKKMPDLNWESENMKADLYEMVDFWCDLGVDGFRVDAVAHLEKAEFIDSDMPKYAPDWKKFSNLPKVYKYLEELKKRIKPNMFTVGEVGGGALLDDCLDYVAYENKRLDMVFTFDHNWRNDGFNSFMDEFKQEIDMKSLKEDFGRFQTGLYQKSWHALYWLNHDHPRVMSQYGNVDFHKESGKMLATILYFMWGTPFIYNGEEIGMTNATFNSINEFRDVATINNYDSMLLEHPKKHVMTFLNTTSRDHSRTPIQWDNTSEAGFTSGTPWIKVNENYKDINVESQMKDPDSILNYYKDVIKVRREYSDTILNGTFEFLDTDTFSYLRKGKTKLLVINNFSKTETEFEHSYVPKKLLISNYKNQLSNKYKLRPYESIVLEVE